MKLSKIKSRVAGWLNPTDKDKAEITRQISDRLRYNRQRLKRSGTVWDDEKQAQKIVKSRRRRLIFWLNQRLISAERRGVEPATRWVYGADLFKIIERLSPTIEALGVIAIPVVLFFATQRYQDNLQQRELEKLQQETVANYLNQLSTILLDVDGDLRDPQNERLRTLTTATTLTLLDDPNLNGERKGQVIKFLSQMDLVSANVVYGPQQPRDSVITIRLSNAALNFASLNFASLSNADLSFANLNRADLVGANLNDAILLYANLRDAILSNAILRDADLSYAILNSADLVGANLRYANLRYANLRYANLRYAILLYAILSDAILSDAILRDAILSDADLRGANLSDADLSGANLSGADLREANLSDANLSDAYLCNTKLSRASNLNPNRDCNKPYLWLRR